MLFEAQKTFKNLFLSVLSFFKHHPIGSGLLISILILNAVILKIIFLFGWDPQDYGGLLSASWRILHGQKPFVDFYFHTVPMILYILAAFIGLLGFSQTAIWAGLVFDSTIACLMLFWGCRRLKLPMFICLLSVILTAAGFHWARSFPLYDHYAPFWGLCGIWILSVFIPFQNKSQAFRAGLLAGVFAILSVITKLTDGMAVGFVLLCAILSARDHRFAAFRGYVLGCFLGLILTWPMISNFKNFLQQNFLYSSGELSRFHGFLSFKNLTTHGYWIPVAIALIITGKRFKQTLEHSILAAGTAFIAIFSYIMGSEKLFHHAPLMGTLVALSWYILYQNLRENKNTKKKIYPQIGIALIVLFSLFQLTTWTIMAIKQRMPQCRHHLMGPCYEYTLQTAPLTGWKTYKYYGQAVDQFTPFIKANIPQKDTLLILADLQILDLLTNRQPYRGIPFQFVWDKSPAKGPQLQLVHDNISNNPPDWIITYKDNSPFRLNVMLNYLGLETFLFDQYLPVYGSGAYIICKRKVTAPK